MIDFLNILEYFPIYLLILHSHNVKKKLKTLIAYKYKDHSTYNRKSNPKRPKWTEHDQIGPNI